MHKSGLEGEKGARTVSVANFYQRKDLEMYSQLPDYGEFQGYYLGIDAVLSQIGRKIFSPIYTIHIGRHRNAICLWLGYRRLFFRGRKFFAGGGKKGDSKQESECSGGFLKSLLLTRFMKW